MNIRLFRFGPQGVLVKFADRLSQASLADSRALIKRLEERPPAGLLEFVPGCDAILLEFSRISDAQLSRLETELRQTKPAEPDAARVHTIPVVYDGPDLEEFAAAKDMRPEDVAAEHCSRVYDVCVIGFSPGFAYLGPLAETLHMPRRKTPRLKVPAGSVGIGGSHTGVYSIASPGGWWLIGSTRAEFFSVDAAAGDGSEKAFLLRAGDRVRFEPSTT